MVQENNEINRFAVTNQAYANSFFRQARINSLMTAVMPSTVAICTITILGYGGSLVIEQQISIGTFVAFFTYVAMVVQPFRVAGFIVNLFQRAAVASDRLFEVLDMAPEHPDHPSGSTPVHIRGDIVFKNLVYRYPGATTDSLAGITFKIDAGETVAVMGRVGSGKTTLMRQLVRLADAPPDCVLVDGHSVLDYPLAQLRAQIALVPQDPFLFADNIANNITYDDTSRDLESIWQAADAADLRNTLERFPEGLNTLVGERGVTLSGGQKQRATLARGLIRHAPVLLLDDCFASVDTATEEHILRQLRQLRKNQTTLLVSHRVSTARHADRIIVLEAGQIVEQGSHRELLNAGGVYADLERIQREGAQDEKSD